MIARRLRALGPSASSDVDGRGLWVRTERCLCREHFSVNFLPSAGRTRDRASNKLSTHKESSCLSSSHSGLARILWAGFISHIYGCENQDIEHCIIRMKLSVAHLILPVLPSYLAECLLSRQRRASPLQASLSPSASLPGHVKWSQVVF